MAARSSAKSPVAKRPSYHHGSLREALVASAVALVREGGAEAFSLRDAAASVGVTASAMYRHFENKSALLTAVAEVGVELQADLMRRRLTESALAWSRMPPKARAIAAFKETWRAYVFFAEREANIFRVIYGPHGLCQLDPPEEGHIAGTTVLLTEVLDGLVHSGVLSAERRAGAEFRSWTTAHGFAALVVDGSAIFADKAQRAEALENLLDFALDGLCGRVVEKT